MQIRTIEPFILHIPVTGGSIADSTHRISHWGVVGVKIATDDGREGYGFTGTHADLASDRLITACIRDCYAPLLVGEDASEISRLWLKLARHPALQWVGRAGITQLALAAVDVALWDLKAKAAEAPLWHLLGGASKTKLEAYNTDIGWLSIPKDQLVEGCRMAVERDGFRRLKVKVGHADPMTDIARLEAVRRAIGDHVTLAIDGNAGEMSQVHVHLAYWHAATPVLGYIPWIKDAFAEPADVSDGYFLRPQQPGAGTTPTGEAFRRYAKPLS